MREPRSVNLFSYGTLQLDHVQVATFGRLLEGRDDAMPGYERTMLEITEAELAAADRYEVSDYRRIEATLRSGKRAWVYVQA